MEIQEILKTMTIEEKAALLCAQDGDSTLRLRALPSVRVGSGFSGAAANSASTPRVCFPSAGAVGCSWDKNLAFSIGREVGLQCCAEGIHLLAAPCAGIARNPLCGGGFNRFSEDPLLTGALAAGYVGGVQSTGVGACLTEFAGTDGTKASLFQSDAVDERALHETYVKPFKTAMQKGGARAVSCAYGLLNGERRSQSPALQKILRETLRFDGAFIAAGGSVYDRAASLAAGVDLSFPAVQGDAASILEGLKSGKITEAQVEESARRVLELIDSCYDDHAYTVDAAQQDAKSVDFAAGCPVLLKNEGVLPLSGDTVTVMGPLAKRFPVQGESGSRVCAEREIGLAEAFGGDRRVRYFEGCGFHADNDALLQEALEKTFPDETVVVVAGARLPDCDYADKETLTLPQEQMNLIERLEESGRNVVAVVVGGGVPDLERAACAKALLYVPYLGQGGTRALKKLLCGELSPSGRLAQTAPLRADVAASELRDCEHGVVRHRESIYAGYRYFDKAGVAPLFPFGHGLGYSAFSYSELVVQRRKDGGCTVSFTVKNEGRYVGAEVPQLYVFPLFGGFIETQRLAAFDKVWLKAGESKTVTLEADADAFAIAEADGGMRVVGGEYELRVGASSRDVRLRSVWTAEGDKLPDAWQAYAKPSAYPSNGDFDKLRGYPPVFLQEPKKGSYTAQHTPRELGNTRAGKLLRKKIAAYAKKRSGGDKTRAARMTAALTNCPLFTLQALWDGAQDAEKIQSLLLRANKNRWIRFKLPRKKPRKP